MNREFAPGRVLFQSLGLSRALPVAAALLLLLVALTAAWWAAAEGSRAREFAMGTSALAAGALVLTFAVAARAMRAVTTGAAVAGAVSALLLFLGGGPGAFAALALVFLLASLTTRLGRRRKLELGAAQDERGRNAAQVLANTGVAALAALGAWQGQGAELWLAASAAALAEAAADTVSSEVGLAVAWPTVLITSWRRVAPGSHGGISLPGTLAGFLAAALVSATCAGVGVIAATAAPLVFLAALLGMMADSLLGATFERRRLMGNDGVNLAGTLVAAAAVLLLA
ncbi:MAG: DUF92 domain-containing protein [Terriglobales bacterium]